MKRLGIFGSSGFAREVGDIAIAMSYEPIYIARDKNELSLWSFSEEITVESEIDRYRDMAFSIGIGENAVRKKIAERFSSHLEFRTLIHPDASFGHQQKALIEKKRGIVVCAGARLTNNIIVGDFSVVNLNVTIGHDVVIEDFVNIAPGACISGNVHIGSECWVGTGAVINQGESSNKLKIGSRTVIGSGSVVLRPCDEDSIYVGIPAKKIK